MTSSKNDGGPAFPWTEVGACKECCGMVRPPRGMSLRDWFAGQFVAELYCQPGSRLGFPDAAKESYELADAMLAERERSQDDDTER